MTSQGTTVAQTGRMLRPRPKVEFFSLGGLMALCWCPRNRLLPWIVAATTLAGLSCWDLLARAGGVDFIILGLAGYEMVIGLTETTEAQPQSVASR